MATIWRVDAMSLWSHIADAISECTGQTFSIAQRENLGGGSINNAYRLSTSQGESFFVKTNSAARYDMFCAEAEGLEEIDASGSIQVPHLITHGRTAQDSFLVLTYMEFSRTTQNSAAQLGQQLAQMHRHTANQFGWHRDNSIGSTPQCNRYTHDWIDFWRNCRLLPQLQLAEKKGYGKRIQTRGAALLDQLDLFFNHYQPKASLLHGDLWSGNVSTTTAGAAMIYDPAVYFGDRETDLAMTELFGGFPAAFYQAYHNAYPLNDGYERRKPLYNLYHLLNHLNLFGSGYLAQVESTVEECLKSK